MVRGNKKENQTVNAEKLDEWRGNEIERMQACLGDLTRGDLLRWIWMQMVFKQK